MHPWTLGEPVWFPVDPSDPPEPGLWGRPAETAPEPCSLVPVLIGRRGPGRGARPYVRDCIIVSLAVAPTGVTFGVVADAAGFDLARIVVMSALVFTGASQFAAVGVINDGGSGGAAVGSALLLAARNALYGPVMRRALPASTPARMGAAQFVIDETTALSTAQTNRRDATGAFWFSGVILWLVWNACSVAGALLGAVLGSPETWGPRRRLPGDPRGVAGSPPAHGRRAHGSAGGGGGRPGRGAGHRGGRADPGVGRGAGARAVGAGPPQEPAR